MILFCRTCIYFFLTHLIEALLLKYLNNLKNCRTCITNICCSSPQIVTRFSKPAPLSRMKEHFSIRKGEADIVDKYFISWTIHADRFVILCLIFEAKLDATIISTTLLKFSNDFNCYQFEYLHLATFCKLKCLLSLQNFQSRKIAQKHVSCDIS